MCTLVEQGGKYRAYFVPINKFTFKGKFGKGDDITINNIAGNNLFIFYVVVVKVLNYVSYKILHVYLLCAKKYETSFLVYTNLPIVHSGILLWDIR